MSEFSNNGLPLFYIHIKCSTQILWLCQGSQTMVFCFFIFILSFLHRYYDYVRALKLWSSFFYIHINCSTHILWLCQSFQTMVSLFYIHIKCCTEYIHIMVKPEFSNYDLPLFYTHINCSTQILWLCQSSQTKVFFFFIFTLSVLHIYYG